MTFRSIFQESNNGMDETSVWRDVLRLPYDTGTDYCENTAELLWLEYLWKFVLEMSTLTVYHSARPGGKFRDEVY